MAEKSAGAILSSTIEKIRDLVDTSTIIGEAIYAEGGVTIIPVSKVTYGFASGGADFPSKSNQELFGGGGGAGVTISPIAFIAVNGDSVKMLPVTNEFTNLDRALSMAPELISKAKEFFSKETKIEIEE